MEKLVVEINCGEKTCGKCGFLNFDGKFVNCEVDTHAYCKIFTGVVDCNCFDHFRLPECIAASKTQKEASDERH